VRSAKLFAISDIIYLETANAINTISANDNLIKVTAENIFDSSSLSSANIVTFFVADNMKPKSMINEKYAPKAIAKPKLPNIEGPNMREIYGIVANPNK